MITETHVDQVILTTSFARLHAAGACVGRYRHLAEALGGVDAAAAAAAAAEIECQAEIIKRYLTETP